MSLEKTQEQTSNPNKKSIFSWKKLLMGGAVTGMIVAGVAAGDKHSDENRLNDYHGTPIEQLQEEGSVQIAPNTVDPNANMIIAAENKKPEPRFDGVYAIPTYSPEGPTLAKLQPGESVDPKDLPAEEQKNLDEYWKHHFEEENQTASPVDHSAEK